MSVPWGASGFTSHASYGYLAYRNIDGLGRLAGLEGFARHAGAGLDYGLIRSRRLNLRLSAGLHWKALVDDAIAGRLEDKRVRSGNVALSGELRDALGGGALTSGSLEWTWGDLDLSRVPAALAADAAGLKTQGHYQRLSAGLARLQTLPGDFALFTHVYGQWASKNLDSSEDFALGGPYGVRAGRWARGAATWGFWARSSCATTRRSRHHGGRCNCRLSSMAGGCGSTGIRTPCPCLRPAVATFTAWRAPGWGCVGRGRI